MKEIGIIERIKELSKTTSNAQDILNSEVNPKNPEERILSILSTTKETKADVAYVALTIGDLVYDTIRLDPDVIRATDFARAEDLGNIFKFSAYAERIKELPISKCEKHIDNIKGYVGERFVAQQLQSEGFEVEFPELSNQKGFDLLVNGEPAQVKCVAEKSSVLDHVEKYPDIPVFVNEEVALSFEGEPNIYPVEGFSMDKIEAATRESIETGDEVLDFEIPLIALTIAIAKNAYYILNAKTDFKHGAINIAYDVAGGYAGGEIGSTSLATLGSALGPYGTIVGGLIGAITGAVYGKQTLTKVKRVVHTRKEEERVEKALVAFLKESYNSSEKSQTIFEKKAKVLNDNLGKKGSVLEALSDFTNKRVKSERKYLQDKRKQLSRAIKHPRELDNQTNDILVAGTNGMTLALRAKVHPHSVTGAMDNLVDSLELVQEKRSKL